MRAAACLPPTASTMSVSVDTAPRQCGPSSLISSTSSPSLRSSTVPSSRSTVDFPPSLPQVDLIDLIDRVGEIPQDGGPLSDLMWSDPADEPSDPSGHTSAEWEPSPRGGGYLFGPLATQKFLHGNGLSLVVRSHQLCLAGWRRHFNGSVLTVWSAPNYVYRCGNAAAVCLIKSGGAQPELRTFNKSERQEESAEHALVEYFM